MSSEWQQLTFDQIKSPSKSAFSMGPFGSRIKAENFVSSGVPVIKGGNLNGDLNSSSFDFLTPEKTAELSTSIARRLDLVITHRGTLGQIGIIPPNSCYPEYIVSQSQLKLSFDQTKANPYFIYYFLRSPVGQRRLLANTSQVGVPAIAQALTSVRNIRVPLPPLGIQDSIVGILRLLDDRIALLRETNSILEAIAQALFKSWFVDFDPVRAKQEGREPEGMDADTVALFPDSFEKSELGLVPSGWRVSSVYDMAQYINGAAYKAFEPNSEQKGLPIIKIAELKAGVTSQTGFSEINMPLKYKINTKDILFSWSGNPDTSIDVFVWPHSEAWLNQHIFRVVPNTEQERSFVLLMLKYLMPVFAEIARNKQTTGLGHVTVADLKRLQVVLPCNKLLEKWNELVDPLLERAFIVMKQAQDLASIRDTLLPRLISGRLRLPEAEAIIEEVTA
jgi:type I restriction enzyme, S subunit